MVCKEIMGFEGEEKLKKEGSESIDHCTRLEQLSTDRALINFNLNQIAIYPVISTFPGVRSVRPRR